MTFLVRLDRPTRAFDVGVDPKWEWDFSLYSQLATDFTASLTLVSPEIAARPPFVGWLRCDFS